MDVLWRVFTILLSCRLLVSRGLGLKGLTESGPVGVKSLSASIFCYNLQSMTAWPQWVLQSVPPLESS